MNLIYLDGFKRIVTIILVSFLVTFVNIVIFAQNDSVISFLASNESMTIYAVTYCFIIGILYFADHVIKKNPLYLTLFAMPLVSLCFLLISSIIGGSSIWVYTVIVVSIIILFLLSYYIYKKVVPLMVINKVLVSIVSYLVPLTLSVVSMLISVNLVNYF